MASDDFLTFLFKPSERDASAAIQVHISEVYDGTMYDTGCTIWESSIVLTHWLLSEEATWRGKQGKGCFFSLSLVILEHTECFMM